MWLVTFLRVHSNSKEVSYLSKQNTYPNLKTTCHIKLNSFLWTKLLENLLLAKYLISVTADLSYDIQLTACMNCVKLWRKKLRVFREALHWKSFLRRNRKIISQSFWGQNINFFFARTNFTNAKALIMYWNNNRTWQRFWTSPKILSSWQKKTESI